MGHKRPHAAPDPDLAPKTEPDSVEHNPDSKNIDTAIFPSRKSTRATPTHVFFWGGILSNWHTGSPLFSGARCFELLELQLAALNVSTPSSTSIATRLLRSHEYNCGEQWMMSCKAWLFEHRNDTDSEDVSALSDTEFAELASVSLTQPGTSTPKLSEKHKYLEASVKRLRDGTLAAVLRATTPRAQKALGRCVANFDGTLWTKVAMAVVTAACVARAEGDEALRALYMASGRRVFVEGSPRDTIWGVGLMWNSKEIEDEKNWKGENRLGRCHDSARDIIVSKSGKQGEGAEGTTS